MRLKLIAAGLTFLAAAPAQAAGGYTATEAPTSVEVVRGDGFMIYGPYGDPGATPCGTSNNIWVASSHPQYEQLLAVVLAALASGMKLSGYVHVCTSIPWFGASFNELTSSSSLRVLK